jgi:ATP-dependent Clp protease ATP-binding subunit ClpC
MNTEAFTLRMRKVLTIAQQEAQRLQSPDIGTQHLLLGLLHEGEGIAASVLKQQGGDLKKASEEVEKLNIHETSTPAKIWTVEAHETIVLAEEETRALNHSYISTEHLLLGLLREQKGVATQFLASSHIELDKTRTLIIETLERERQRRNPETNN